MAKAKGISLPIRIQCLYPPEGLCEGKPAQFGLQDKAQHLQTGQIQTNEALQFECTVAVIEGQSLDFKGAYVHGTPVARFLYLSLGCPQGDKWYWIRRIKIMLTSISPQQIEAAIASKGILATTVDGHRSGAAKLTEKDWNML